MEILVHRLGRALGDRPLQLLQRCLPDGLHAFEVLEQLGPALFPHPGYFVQNGAFYVSRLELPVVFDGEAVGLLLDLPDEGEHCRHRLDTDLPPVGVDQGTCSMEA